MIIQWTRSAIDDLIAIRAYIAALNPDAAQKIGQRISGTVTKLTQNPHMGRAGRLHGTRELIISGTPYLVAYRISGDRIDILRVIHGKRKWPEYL